MSKKYSDRIITTPSSYAKEHYLYVQETGSLHSTKPHISKREHLASLLFFVVTSGSGTLVCYGKKHPLKKGDCIFLHCLEEYSHESSENDPWELSWVHFYGKDAAEIYRHYREQDGLFLFHPGDVSPFLSALRGLFEEQTRKDSCYEQKCHKYLTDIVTACYLESGSCQRAELNSIYEKIRSVRAYLDEHFAENLSLDLLSSQFFISKFYLSREFKRLTGVTIGYYLNGRRIDEAKRLLRFSQESIGSIAASCGIPDVNYFTKVFTKYESMTPSAYRKSW